MHFIFLSFSTKELLAYSLSKMGKKVLVMDFDEQKNIDVLQKLQNMGSAVTKSNGTVSLVGDIQYDKRMDIVIGLPAAGKSSALAEPISELYKSRIIDSDEAKKLLPEYKDGWGAGVVHKESQSISKIQLQEALYKGENIIYPRVGGDCKELEDQILNAKEKGYKVYVHLNDLDKNKALGRMINRFLETGRFINPDLITKYGNSIEDTYQTLKKGNIIDGFSKWSTAVLIISEFHDLLLSFVLLKIDNNIFDLKQQDFVLKLVQIDFSTL